MSGEALALGGLAASAFLSSTLLPGNSEIALAAFLYKWPHDASWALAVATFANTAGSLTSLVIGRLAPRKEMPPRIERLFARYGSASLALAWVPFIGDAIPLAAGWLRLPVVPCVIWLTLGKAARYAILAYSVIRLAG
ncbi:YqaA family protein [Paludibacterium paludis]|uniref:Membrane protein n=1 Tax=Paludibacterium paludis TaxID=1225769 RepID=A0A918P1I9_9NEIS|nr:YqaA family protein [Paludibacterium paludis]GGY12339.1 membrane protein [Paludibacterium paludis]